MKVFDIINEATSWSQTPPGILTSRWMTKNATLAARYEKQIMAKWGYKFYGLLRLTQIAAPCLQFAGRVMALEDIAGLSDEEFTKFTGQPAENKAQWVTESREMMWALFTAQILLPVIYIFVKQLPVISHILAILAGSAGVVFAKRGQAFVIGAKMVEQSAVVALMVWLGTEEGATWLGNSFFKPFMMPVGKIETSAWDFISKKFFDVTGLPQPEKSNVAKDVEKNAGPGMLAPTRAEIQAADDEKNARTRPKTL